MFHAAEVKDRKQQIKYFKDENTKFCHQSILQVLLYYQFNRNIYLHLQKLFKFIINFPHYRKSFRMSLFIVEGLIIQNNPAPVNSPFIIDVRFKCLQKLEGIFDWKVIYVGSANDPSYDQVIESFDMSNLEADVMQIQIQAPPPDFSKIPQQYIVGNTAIVISISYEGQEFFRVGYFIRNQYQNEEMNENPPQQPIINQLSRFIMSEVPRVSNFEIEWVKREGKVEQDMMCVEKNIEIMGGDPFLQSNGAFQMLENMNINVNAMFNQNQQ